MTDGKAKRLAIIASKGTLDMAYPPFILATTATAMDMEAAIFFTFYGLNILKKGGVESLQVAPIANPAMPVPVPNALGILPGMTFAATAMMKGMMRNAHMASLKELLALARESGVRLIACQTTMEIMGVKKEDLLDGVEIGGAATFLDFASENAIALAF